MGDVVEVEEGEEIAVTGELVGEREEDCGEGPNESEFCHVVGICLASVFPFI